MFIYPEKRSNNNVCSPLLSSGDVGVTMIQILHSFPYINEGIVTTITCVVFACFIEQYLNNLWWDEI